jgi:hypothetical protein
MFSAMTLVVRFAAKELVPMCSISGADFAHNDEANRVTYLGGVLLVTCRPETLSLCVLINGCKDNTKAIGREYAK